MGHIRVTLLPKQFEHPPKIIRPRTRRAKVLPVITVVGDDVLTEAGQVETFDDLIGRLPAIPSSLIATINSPNLLVDFTSVFSVSHPNAWKWSTTDDRRMREKTSVPHKRMESSTLCVRYCGFKNGNVHKLIDPVTMFGGKLSELLPGDDPLIVRLHRWALRVRDFCAVNNLEVRPTKGGIAVQFLTDSRFYDRSRRKVPAFINTTGREKLPGHHYHVNLTLPAKRTYNAYMIDQKRAWHYHAQHLHFPHADHLHAIGCYQNLEHCYRDGTPSLDFMGLYCLDLGAPVGRAYSWLPGRGRLERVFVWTNELPHLLDMGYKVLGIRAAWGSHHRDYGLNRYSAWAQEQLDRHSDRWLKSLLLCTYGDLACRRTYCEQVFSQARRGTLKVLLTGRGPLHGMQTQRSRALEPNIVNAIQLGMIQAATRSESIGFTQWLEHQGQRILHIFADAVIVEVNEDRPLPVLPEPWEVDKELTHYRPISPVGYESDQEMKNPGHRHRDRRMIGVGSPRLELVQRRRRIAQLS